MVSHEIGIYELQLMTSATKVVGMECMVMRNRLFTRIQDRPIGDHKQPLIGNDAYSTAQDSVKPSDDAYLPMSPVNAKPSSTQPAKSLADSGSGDNKFKLIPKLDFPLGNKDDGGLQFMYPVNHK